MRSVLIYHVYISRNWKSVTDKILNNAPHDEIVVNVSIDWYKLPLLSAAIRHLSSIPKVANVFYTINNRKFPEAKGFDNLRRKVDFSKYDLLTYAHGKGVSKRPNQNIADWVELMRYFVIERLDLCKRAFADNYLLYGVNIGVYKPGDKRYGPYKFSDFHYSGNFASINLTQLRDKFLSTPCDTDYFGVEGFWGKLCDLEKAYCAHFSSPNISNHYEQRYPLQITSNDSSF